MKHFAHWSLAPKAPLQVEARLLTVPSLHCLDEQPLWGAAVFCARAEWSKPLTTSTTIKVEDCWRKFEWRCITPSHSKPPVARAQLKSHEHMRFFTAALSARNALPFTRRSCKGQAEHHTARLEKFFIRGGLLRGARLCP